MKIEWGDLGGKGSRAVWAFVVFHSRETSTVVAAEREHRRDQGLRAEGPPAGLAPSVEQGEGKIEHVVILVATEGGPSDCGRSPVFPRWGPEPFPEILLKTFSPCHGLRTSDRSRAVLLCAAHFRVKNYCWGLAPAYAGCSGWSSLRTDIAWSGFTLEREK